MKAVLEIQDIKTERIWPDSRSEFTATDNGSITQLVSIFQVYCDQKTAGGGWTVFQKRKDGSVNFYRGWKDYNNGFGDVKGEFWLGLDNIYRLTHQARNRLRVDLEDTKGKSAYAKYNYFAVYSERSKYRLSLGNYSGNSILNYKITMM